MRRARLLLAFVCVPLAIGGSFFGVPPAYAAFPGANGKIAFALDDRIWSMNPDGTGLIQLTTGLHGFEHTPAWSADGTKIVFTGSSEIYVMNADGTGQANVTNDPAFDAYAVWSPSGRRIAFASDRANPSGNLDIYVMNADGSNVTRLTTRGGAYPAWSPNGTRIAFSRLSNIYVMRADGSDKVNLTHHKSGAVFLPDWSPDNKRLAYQRSAGGDHDIWVINADGTGRTNLTHDSAFEGHPGWSPNGKRIAFCHNFDIATIRPNGTGLRDLTKTTAEDTGPDWQPIPAIIALSPSSGPAGSAVDVTGQHFGAGEDVRITFVDRSGNSLLGIVTADATGAFSASVTVPGTASSGPHTVKAKGLTTGRKALATFTVT
jgi:Tol biopolymer transport system component